MSLNLGESGEQTLNLQYPLHKACRDGDQERLTALLSAGQYNLYEEDGYYAWTPTHWASYFGKLSCLMTLTEHGCHSDLVTNRFNQSPLHIAALGGNCHCLKWLLHCGASINRQDYLGDTPMHKAARAGSMECISLLLSQNAALDLKNYNGQTPGEVAKNSSHTHCGEYLDRALQLQQVGQLNSTLLDVPHMNHNQLSKEVNGINGHTTMHNAGLNGDATMDCDMEMESSSHPHDQNESHNTHNGFYYGADGSKEINGEFPNNSCGDNNNSSSVFRAFSGIKRSMDDEEDEGIKRRCFREGKCEETPLNNNVLSSYHSILAISTAPVKTDPVCSSGELSSMNTADLNDNDRGEENRMSDNNIACDRTRREQREMSYLSFEAENHGLSSLVAKPVCPNAPPRCVGLSSHFI